MEAERSQYMISGRRCVWHVPREQRWPRCRGTWCQGRLGRERGKDQSQNPLQKLGVQRVSHSGPCAARCTGAENRDRKRAHAPQGLLPSLFSLSHLLEGSGPPRTEEARNSSRTRM